jgi:hypothetical protein
MQVHCPKCGYEPDLLDRFCGMCGAELPWPQPTPPTDEPTVQSKPARDQVSAVSGPSFLGLGDDSDNDASYLLEDDIRVYHWGRAVVLIGMLGCLVIAAWHWRHDVSDWTTAKFSHQPSARQTQEVSYSASPISTSNSEAAKPNARSSSENPSTENAPKPGVQPQPAGNAVGPGNAFPATQTIQQPSAAPTEAQMPVGATPPITRPPLKDKASAPTGSFAEERSPKEYTAQPSRPAVPVASSNTGNVLEAEGERYLYGTRSPANCALARKDFLAAAERSSAKSESLLGGMYATGHCVPRDLPLAYRWFAKALQQEPGNARFERDVQILWKQMTPQERQIATHNK